MRGIWGVVEVDEPSLTVQHGTCIISAHLGHLHTFTIEAKHISVNPHAIINSYSIPVFSGGRVPDIEGISRYRMNHDFPASLVTGGII
jgi:hypothetical protein